MRGIYPPARATAQTRGRNLVPPSAHPLTHPPSKATPSPLLPRPVPIIDTTDPVIARLLVATAASKGCYWLVGGSPADADTSSTLGVVVAVPVTTASTLAVAPTRAIPPSGHVIPPPALPTRRARRPTVCSAPAIPPALERVPTLLSPRCRTSSAVPRAARSPGSKARRSAYAENARGRLGIALARWPSSHASTANAENARRSSGSALEQKRACVGLLLVVRSRLRRLGACRSGPARAVPPLARRRVTLRRCPRPRPASPCPRACRMHQPAPGLDAKRYARHVSAARATATALDRTVPLI
ncbi:hypothetical protein EV121DRAFT_297966 [Schizophyllum commune]